MATSVECSQWSRFIEFSGIFTAIVYLLKAEIEIIWTSAWPFEVFWANTKANMPTIDVK